MKQFLIWTIVVLIFLIIVNKVSKQFLNQTKYEKDTRINDIQKIYGNNYEDYLKVLEQQNYPLLYTPFTEFREKERNLKFVSVSKYGNRCNKNDIEICQGPKGGKDEIWIFGGSSTFGYGLKNDETIAASLDQIIKNKKVINFGQAYYNSTQNRIFFQNLLSYFPEPDTVIFFEGFNDFRNEHLLGYQYPGVSSLSKHYENLFETKEISSADRFKQWLKKRFNRLNFVRLYKQLTNQEVNINQIKVEKIKNENKAYEILIKKLEYNLKINKVIGDKFSINIVNVMEPIGLSENSYRSSSLPSDYLKDIDNLLEHHKKIYHRIENDLDFFNNVDLNLINFQIKEKMFIDRAHFSKKFSRKIAEKVSEILN